MLALAFRQKSLKPFKVVPLRSEADGTGIGCRAKRDHRGKEFPATVVADLGEMGCANLPPTFERESLIELMTSYRKLQASIDGSK